MNTPRSERGQVLVLILLAMVGLMGFAALAVDGGQIYSERRRSQTAADSAALAAAKTGSMPGSTETQIQTAGLGQATLNGFSSGGTTTVSIHHPPVSGPYAGDSEYYQAIITHQVAPMFSQFVFAGTQAVTSEAVARATDITQLSSGNALHSLSPEDDSMEMDGTTTVKIKGGNIFSNGGGIKHGASGQVRVTDGGILIAKDNGWTCTGCKEGQADPTNNTVLPAADDTGNAPQSIATFEAPWCPAYDLTARPAGSYVGYYNTYNTIKVYLHEDISASTPTMDGLVNDASTDTLMLQPGIHCIRGDIDLQGKSVLKGSDVLLVMLQGGIKIKGSASLDLTRDSNIKDKIGNEYGGLLIYAIKGNTSTITLGGTSDSFFNGTVYAPDGLCDVGGNSTASGPLHAQIVCWKIKLHGDNTVNIVYKAEENVQLPASIEVSQ